jgi:beta-glucosidase
MIHPWQNPELSANDRVTALLEEMTLQEKVAQLGSVWPGVKVMGGNVAPMMDVFDPNDDFAEQTKHGIGHVTRAFGTQPISAADGRERLDRFQRHLTTSTRLGIPAIAHEECLTGFTTLGATVYPTPLAWAATFDPTLVLRMASTIGRDMAAVGVHQGLSPVLDVVRDYRWGRVEETLGEDPYLVSQLGAAYVKGLEEQGVMATLKHFAGYSASAGARNHAPVSMGPRQLADVILPPFEYAVRVGRTSSVMNSYSDVDGVPAAADQHLLTQILREEWGFEGTVVSDYWAVAFLRSMHKVADSLGQAAALALAAGIDVELPTSLCYSRPLLDLLTAGHVDEALVDRAVRRVLAQKVRLGLLDADPFADRLPEVPDFDAPGNRDIARALADRSVVLLANPRGVLPLDDVARVAVVGPVADDPQAFFGCYSFPNHVLPSFPEHGMGIEALSLVAALREELPGVEIVVSPGCAVTGGDLTGIPAAVDAARSADLTILAVGDRSGIFGGGTSGEGCDVPDLYLPGHQPALVEAVLGTGRPVVLVCVSGRPYALDLYAERTAATVQAFFPGEEGGQAIAGVLSGRVNPSGKLPVQVPRRPGGQPHTYLAPPLGQNTEGVSSLDPTPAFAFGHGLSYSTIEYADLRADAATIPADGSVDLSVTVTNTSSRDAEEVVQLYFSDPVASVTRPVSQLVGFTRIHLPAERSADVTFTVHSDRVSFTGLDLRRIVEPGQVVFNVGTAARAATDPVTVTLEGERRVVVGERVMHTPATVQLT